MSKAPILALAAILTVVIAIIAQDVTYEHVVFQGNSMLPLIHPGDTGIALREPFAGYVQVGQIISFWCMGEHLDVNHTASYDCGAGFYISHRVINSNSTAVLTKGDNNQLSDWWILRSTVYSRITQVYHNGTTILV